MGRIFATLPVAERITMSHPREAKLRPEYAGLYPGVPPGIWLPAADLGAALLMQHLRAPAPPELGNRLLDESHFEFRGGAARGQGAAERTRHGENGKSSHPPQPS